MATIQTVYVYLYNNDGEAQTNDPKPDKMGPFTNVMVGDKVTVFPGARTLLERVEDDMDVNYMKWRLAGSPLVFDTFEVTSFDRNRA